MSWVVPRQIKARVQGYFSVLNLVFGCPRGFPKTKSFRDSVVLSATVRVQRNRGHRKTTERIHRGSEQSSPRHRHPVQHRHNFHPWRHLAPFLCSQSCLPVLVVTAAKVLSQAVNMKRHRLGLPAAGGSTRLPGDPVQPHPCSACLKKLV